MLAVDKGKLKKVEERLVKALYAKQVGRHSLEYFRLVSSELLKGQKEGFKSLSGVSFNSPDHQANALMQLSVHKFSASKSMAMTLELNKKLQKATTFKEFQEMATPVLDTYNTNYLRTEYEFARAASQNGSRYLTQQASIEAVPYYIYKTVGDDRVRPAHQGLHNMIFRKDDSTIDALYPPNGWRCRCEMIETSKVPRGQKLSTGKDAISTLDATEAGGESEWDRMKKGGFNINRGKLSDIFTTNQMYLSGEFEKSLGLADNDLVKYQDLDQSKFNVFKSSTTSKKEAQDWFNSKLGKNELESKTTLRLLDYNKRPLALKKSVFTKNLTGNDTKYAGSIQEVLSKPDEVFLIGNTIRYIKYYKDQPINVLVKVDKKSQSLNVTSWDGGLNVDPKRKGILIK